MRRAAGGWGSRGGAPPVARVVGGLLQQQRQQLQAPPGVGFGVAVPDEAEQPLALVGVEDRQKVAVARPGTGPVGQAVSRSRGTSGLRRRGGTGSAPVTSRR